MRETINEAYKAALKARDQRRTATLRAINAAFKDRDIAARGEGKAAPDDAELLAVLQKMVKQREESLEIYEKAGREDLAAVERDEIAIIGEFLPRGLSEAELDAAIATAIGTTAASGIKDMGKVVQSLKAEYPGRIDFAKASPRIRAALG
jgi:uncharacterized protein YqeY